MKIALVIFAFIVLIFAVWSFVPLYVVVGFSKTGEQKNTDIRIKYLFLKITIKTKGDIIGLLKELIGIYKEAEDEVIDILHFASEKAVKVKFLRFFVNFGFSDPMNTGITTGTLYGVVYNVLAVINKFFEVEECDIKIDPDFERKHLDIDSECILRIKTVHIISIAFKVLKMYLKIKNKK